MMCVPLLLGVWLAQAPVAAAEPPVNLSLQVALVKLAHGNAQQRRAALAELPQFMKAADALPYVKRALKDPSQPNRVLAIQLLGSMKSTGLPTLLRLLTLTLPLAEYQAALAVIGYQEDPHTVSVLGGALRYPDVKVRVNAVAYLNRLRDVSAIPYFQQGLGDSSPKVRALSAIGLGELATPVCYTLLVACVTDPTSHVRRNALRMLERVQDPRALPYFVEALNDPDVRNREEAFRILKRQPLPDVRSALLRAMEQPQDGVRLRAAIALGELERPLPDVLAIVTHALQHAESRTRLLAAETLSQWLEPSTMPALRAVRRDPDGAVRKAVRTALEMMGDVDLEPFRPAPWQP